MVSLSALALQCVPPRAPLQCSSNTAARVFPGRAAAVHARRAAGVRGRGHMSWDIKLVTSIRGSGATDGDSRRPLLRVCLQATA